MANSVSAQPASLWEDVQSWVVEQREEAVRGVYSLGRIGKAACEWLGRKIVLHSNEGLPESAELAGRAALKSFPFALGSVVFISLAINHPFIATACTFSVGLITAIVEDVLGHGQDKEPFFNQKDLWNGVGLTIGLMSSVKVLGGVLTGNPLWIMEGGLLGLSTAYALQKSHLLQAVEEQMAVYPHTN